MPMQFLLVWWDNNEENQICPISFFTGRPLHWICCLSAKVTIYLLSRGTLSKSYISVLLHRFCKEGISIREALKGHVCWGWHLLVKLCNPTKRASRLASLSKAMPAGDDKSCLEKQRYNSFATLNYKCRFKQLAKAFFQFVQLKISGMKNPVDSSLCAFGSMPLSC